MYVCFYESACFFWFLGVHECVRVCYIVSVSSFLMFKECCVLWTTFGGMCDFMFRCVSVCVKNIASGFVPLLGYGFHLPALLKEIQVNSFSLDVLGDLFSLNFQDLGRFFCKYSITTLPSKKRNTLKEWLKALDKFNKKQF